MDMDELPGTHEAAPTITVLYVDDDPDLLAIGCRFLQRIGGYRVEPVHSACEALLRLQELEVDLVLSDYQMPEMDGITFLKVVRQDYVDLPFILFTGRGREEIVIEALNSGADFYLQKGGDPRSQFVELDHKIRQAVSRRRAVRRAISLDRLYALLSKITAALVDVRDCGALYQECCRITVETGHFQYAWIGLCDGDARTLMPVAFSGDSVHDAGSVLLAIPSIEQACQRACATRDIQTLNEMSEDFSPGDALAESSRSYLRSTAVFPLVEDDRSIGVLLVGSSEPSFFSSEEVGLLARVANEIAYAAGALRREEDNCRMRDQLADCELRFQLFADNSLIGYMSLDKDGRIMEVNRSWTALMDERSDRAEGRLFRHYIAPSHRPSYEAHLSELMTAEVVGVFRTALCRSDGPPAEVEFIGRASRNSSGQLVGIHCLLFDPCVRSSSLTNGIIQFPIAR
jgi:PAS domain S-box-containing protein